ncbi:chemotaxis protein CheW [Sinorhizobium numidicum]|uniref:Chemotaxis protein CheW n=1 Tax=Sinorhizobium numidicum TaxID=680248 RepID=A0ABY8CQY5_9HYPH|nr:chemotaxis protein CheW [Sinorhizobium numidicum]WEX75072.1 chemotaxis protein CheW [Sinorhizobium numidicum]WEX81066.1 chemotaxis protein CheW [Sinorhizobium numidicum]
MTTHSKAANNVIDWAAVRRRMSAAIEQTEALLESAEHDAGASGERHPSLPGPEPAAGEGERLAGVVSFVLSERRFAVDTRYICEIISKARVSPLPGMPAYVFGLYDLRGQLLPVFDLRGLLELQRDIPATADWAVVCGETQPEFLILSESMPEVTELSPEDMLPAHGDGSDGDWGRAMTSDGTVVLDGDLFLNDPRFFLEGEEIAAGDAREKDELQ